MRRPLVASTVAIMGDAAPTSTAPVMELLMNLSKRLFQSKFALPISPVVYQKAATWLHKLYINTPPRRWNFPERAVLHIKGRVATRLICVSEVSAVHRSVWGRLIRREWSTNECGGRGSLNPRGGRGGTRGRGQEAEA